MKSKVVNITIPEKLLKEINQAAQKEGRTRSEFFREASRDYLRNISFSESGLEKPVSPEFSQTPPPPEVEEVSKPQPEVPTESRDV